MKVWLSKFVTLGLGAIPILVLGWLLFDIFSMGWQEISWEFLTETPKDAGRAGGISSIIVSTVWVVTIAAIVTTTIGLASAIMLSELSSQWAKLCLIVRWSLDILAGVPSIVFGLFGNAFFSQVCGFGFSILSGALTLACMMLPFFIRVAEEGLRQVPNIYRQTGYALGMRPLSVTFKIVVPQASKAIVIGLVLSLARAMSETAALLFTSGYVDRWPESVFDSGRVLSIHIYDLAMNVPGGIERANGSALVLIALLVFINVTIYAIAGFWEKRRVI